MRNVISVSVSHFLVILVLVANAATLWAQKKFTCPTGEVRIEIDVANLQLNYQGKSFETTLSGLNVLAGKLAISPKTLQEASAATQQWNELLKGLAAGWNSCAISQQQYDDGVKRIYPRLKDDAGELEEIRQALAKGQQTDARRLQQVLDRYFANLRSFAEASESKLAEIQQEVHGVRDDIKEILARLQKPVEARKEISALKQELLGKADEAESEYNQGYELVQRYQFRDAVPHLKRAVDAVPLPAFYETLGVALLQLPDLREAERVVREGLQHLNGKAEQEARLDALLGLILKHQGDLVGAMSYSKQALKIAEKLFGPDHPAVAAFVGNIGQILKAQGDLAGALCNSQRALKIDEKVYGPDHPSVARDARTIAEILEAQGDLAGALLNSQRALQIDEKYGRDHPWVAVDASNISHILKAQGDMVGALSYSQRALKIVEKVKGPYDPSVAILANNVGAILKAQGDLAGALSYGQRALAILQQFYGSDNPDTKIVAANVDKIKQEIQARRK